MKVLKGKRVKCYKCDISFSDMYIHTSPMNITIQKDLCEIVDRYYLLTNAEWHCPMCGYKNETIERTYLYDDELKVLFALKYCDKYTIEDVKHENN